MQDPHISGSCGVGAESRYRGHRHRFTGFVSGPKPNLAWLSQQTGINQLLKRGAVGHICAHHFDVNGNILEIDLHRGIIGAGLEPLHTAAQVIGIASGLEKSRAILGALRGKHINTSSRTTSQPTSIESSGRYSLIIKHKNEPSPRIDGRRLVLLPNNYLAR